MREIQSVVRKNLAHYNATPVASASSVDLGAQIGLFLDISGTTTITSFGSTATAGIWKVLRFQGALSLTYNATSLILPGDADITTVADDVAIFYCVSTGNWMCAAYMTGNNRGISSGVVSIAGNTTLTVSATSKLHIVSATATVTLPAASAMSVGESIKIKSTTTGEVLIDPAGTDTLDGLTTNYRLPSFSNCEITKSAAGAFVLSNITNQNVGDWTWAGYGTALQGWVKAGQDISRTTYASLFSVYGTTYGVGNGTTTFGLPLHQGRAPMGAGTGTMVEIVTASSGNGFTVVSNNTKWITGMTVVLSALSGFTTTATAGPTYYVVRISATNIRLATTLALAQNNTPDITISGSGSATITHTMTARTLGEVGGEEVHAMSLTELLSHQHNVGTGLTDIDQSRIGGGRNSLSATIAIDAAGGNAAMNITQPFMVGELYIKT